MARDTIRKALRDEPILIEASAKRLSSATKGAITVEQLMEGGVRAKPKKKAAKAKKRKPSRGRKASSVRRTRRASDLRRAA